MNNWTGNYNDYLRAKLKERITWYIKGEDSLRALEQWLNVRTSSLAEGRRTQILDFLNSIAEEIDKFKSDAITEDGLKRRLKVLIKGGKRT